MADTTPTTTAAPKIYAAMAKIMADVGAIGKDKRNQQQGFNYRGVDDFYNALNSVMAENGVFTTSEILAKSREERATKDGKGILAFTCLRIRYRFWAEDGSGVETEVEGEGMDSGDKSSNKAMAIAHKYALMQAFCIPTKEMVDPDSESHELGANADQKEAPLQQQNHQQSLQDGGIDQRVAWVARAIETIKKIDTRDALDKWWNTNKSYLEALTEDQCKEVDRAAGSRVGALKPPPKEQQKKQGPDWATDLNDDIPF